MRDTLVRFEILGTLSPYLMRPVSERICRVLAAASRVREGIEYFQQAIEKDPGYALAYEVWVTPTLRSAVDGSIFHPATLFQRRKRWQ